MTAETSYLLVPRGASLPVLLPLDLHDRSSAAEKKERQIAIGQVVNHPQDSPLDFHADFVFACYL